MGIENDHQKWKIPTAVPLKPTSWLVRIPIESEISVGGYHQPSSRACAVTGISKKDEKRPVENTFCGRQSRNAG